MMTHQQNTIGSKTLLHCRMHLQTIIRRQLFTGHMVGSWPWKGQQKYIVENDNWISVEKLAIVVSIKGLNDFHYVVQACFVQTGLHWWHSKLFCGHIQRVKVILFDEFEAFFCHWTRPFNRDENPLFQTIIVNKIISCHYGRPNVAIFNSYILYSILYSMFNYLFNIQFLFSIQCFSSTQFVIQYAIIYSMFNFLFNIQLFIQCSTFF